MEYKENPWELNEIVDEKHLNRIETNIRELDGSRLKADADISRTKVYDIKDIDENFPIPEQGEIMKIILGKIRKFFDDFLKFKDSLVVKKELEEFEGEMKNTYIPNKEKGIGRGIATLEADGKVPEVQLNIANQSMAGVVKTSGEIDLDGNNSLWIRTDFIESPNPGGIYSGETFRTILGKISKWWGVINNKLDKSSVANNLVTTNPGFALDARKGKALQDQINKLNSDLVKLSKLTQLNITDVRPEAVDWSGQNIVIGYYGSESTNKPTGGGGMYISWRFSSTNMRMIAFPNNHTTIFQRGYGSTDWSE